MITDTGARPLLSLVHFSARSLTQAYGRTFIRRILLRHPLAALRGLRGYLSLPAPQSAQRVLLHQGAAEFLQQAAGDGERLLVATGFCQKPLPTAAGGSGCPAGRFNHRCACLSNSADGTTQVRPAATCGTCFIRVLGRAALGAGASFAVLTSALDIAHDILIPSLEEGRFARFLFAICPYSVEPMTLALLICGLEGYLTSYEQGACADYDQWLRADHGDKPERTVLSSGSSAKMLQLLERVAALRQDRAVPQPSHYELRDNVYRPRFA